MQSIHQWHIIFFHFIDDCQTNDRNGFFCFVLPIIQKQKVNQGLGPNIKNCIQMEMMFLLFGSTFLIRWLFEFGLKNSIQKNEKKNHFSHDNEF
jgi:hypothetical protein